MQAIWATNVFEKHLPQIGMTPLPRLLAALFCDVAAFLEVERVSYSQLEADHSAIQPELRFHRSTRECDTTGLPKLYAKDHPRYFTEILRPPGVVISHDVTRDERLKDFWKGCVTPLKIASMLSVPVHRAGRLYGVIWHEHTGPKRRWTDEEVNAASSFAHFVALAVETDERQRLEKELRVSLQREQELAAMKTNFTSLVSHEFRTPLGIIVSSADILEAYSDRLRPEQRTAHLHDIRYAAQQMTSLMEEVLLLGKVDSGKMECRREPLDVADFCQRVVDEHRSTSDKCPVELKLAGVSGAAQGDTGLLRPIMGNLISNAVKYSPAGSKVAFRVRRDGGDAIFEIDDHGIGIDPADHAHLFTAFHRGANVGAIPGTGLGLAIVKRCVMAHGGAISFTSAPGQGTSFTVRLPMFVSVARSRLRKAASPGRENHDQNPRHRRPAAYAEEHRPYSGDGKLPGVHRRKRPSGAGPGSRAKTRPRHL
jgi:signal transduction histidine kinase